MIPKEEVDKLVADIRELITTHGAMSSALADVRKWYAIFCVCPEAGSFVALEEEVKKVKRYYEADMSPVFMNI